MASPHGVPRIRAAIVHPEIEAFDEYRGGAIARWTAEILRRCPDDVEMSVLTKPARGGPYTGIRGRVVPMRCSWLEVIPGATPRLIHAFWAEALLRLRWGRYDVVHVHARPQWILPLRRRLPGARIVLHQHNDDMGFWPLHEVAEVVRAADLVLCCSDYLRRRVVGTEPTSSRPTGRLPEDLARRVRVLRNGVDVARFRPTSEPRAAGTRGDEVTLACVGRLVEEKAPHLAMKAVLELRRRGRAVRMLIVGAHDFGPGMDTPYIASLRELATRDPKAFELTGYVHSQDLPRVLARAEIYVHACTWNEPFGLATAEAMACGLAPIVSRRGGNLEVVGDAGLAFEPADPPGELVAAVESLVLDPPRLARLRAMARERAVACFDWGPIAQEYYATLREIVGAKRPREGHGVATARRTDGDDAELPSVRDAGTP
jgi:glycosyltransferase involved in cell wall biosynthesis